MKSILSILFILISIQLYSQNELKNYFFKLTNAVNVEKNHFQSQDISEKFNFQLFEEIKKSEDLKKYHFAEKKFNYTLNDNFILRERIQDKLIEDNKGARNKSIFIEWNEDFIEKMIVRIYIENNHIQEIIIGNSKNQGNRNFDLYRNAFYLKDTLMVNYPIDKNKTIQLGNSIMPYLSKILKKNIDKTLNTSLNLLVVNF